MNSSLGMICSISRFLSFPNNHNSWANTNTKGISNMNKIQEKSTKYFVQMGDYFSVFHFKPSNLNATFL